MRSFLTILGGAALLVIILFIGIAIFMGVQLGPANEEAQSYARETILAVASSWSTEELYARADEELQANLKQGEVETLMGQGARAVGDLESLGDITCSTNVTTSTGAGKVISARCTAQGAHERGAVDYTVGVIRKNGQWGLNSFHFNAVEVEDTPTEV